MRTNRTTGLRWPPRPDALTPVLAGALAWALPALLLAFTVMLGTNFEPLHVERMSAGPVFVLGIAIIGATSGLATAVFCALLATLIFEFFFVAPLYAIEIDSARDLLPPALFMLSALVSGTVGGRLKEKSARLAQSNRQLESLLEMSRLLQAAPDVSAVRKVVIEALAAKLGLRLYLFGQHEGTVVALAGDTPGQPFDLARRVVTGPAFAQDGRYLAYRIEDSRSGAGALVADCGAAAGRHREILEALALMVGLALERAQLGSELAYAQAMAKTEELRSALLASVSINVRKPVAAIGETVERLRAPGAPRDARGTARALRDIASECDRIEQFSANLLELSRLETGVEGVAGQELAVGALLRTVIARKCARWPGREITLTQGEAEPWVLADAGLFDLALTNVLENALLYSDADTPVAVVCRSDDEDCVVEISDAGCGIPAHEQSWVFHRFYRVRREDQAPGGTGLGLAIAKTFAEAFGGSIALRSPLRDGKGTMVTIRLPLCNALQS
ncbi:MAG: DUF4118 domain-containing protein [Sphingomonadales bacterium]|nr:DUF4118 domain-containing protein [Sphingomonadales bacterium]